MFFVCFYGLTGEKNCKWQAAVGLMGYNKQGLTWVLSCLLTNTNYRYTHTKTKKTKKTKHVSWSNSWPKHTGNEFSIFRLLVLNSKSIIYFA